MTQRIDLHTHSTASDGTTPPGRLMAEAREQGLDVVALTDHDTTAGWDEATAALPAGLTLVPGAELSCVSSDGISLHLLAYLFDPTEPTLRDARRELRESRLRRAERMVGSLAAAGTGVTWERVTELAGGAVGRPHIARALMEQGLVGSVDEAFSDVWIGTRGPHFRGKLELDAAEAVRMVTAAGGLTVFAHPLAVSRGRVVGDDVIRELADAGLVGLEVDHPDHDELSRRRLRDLAAELDLVVTGSSDYHGTNKTTRLGAHLTEPAQYAALLERPAALLVRGG